MISLTKNDWLPLGVASFYIMKQLLTNFVSFSQGVHCLDRNTDATIGAKLLFIGQALLFIFLFKVVIAIISISLNKYGLIEQTKGSGDLTAWLSETSNTKFILEVVILAPLLEETSFRGILQSDRITITVAFTVLFYLLTCVVAHTDFYSFTIRTISISGISILAGILFHKFAADYLLNVTSDYNSSIYIIWFSACGFALWHYNNYDFTAARPQTILLALLPHFISGLIFSWTSLMYGLRWSIILHIINNAIPVLITIWRASQDTKVA